MFQVLQSVGRQLKGSGLREVMVGGVRVRSVKSPTECEHLLLAALTTHLHHLSHLSIIGLQLNTTQAAAFGKVSQKH